MLFCNHLQKVGRVCDVSKCLTLRGLNQHSFPVCDVSTHLVLGQNICMHLLLPFALWDILSSNNMTIDPM